MLKEEKMQELDLINDELDGERYTEVEAESIIKYITKPNGKRIIINDDNLEEITKSNPHASLSTGINECSIDYINERLKYFEELPDEAYGEYLEFINYVSDNVSSSIPHPDNYVLSKFDKIEHYIYKSLLSKRYGDEYFDYVFSEDETRRVSVSPVGGYILECTAEKMGYDKFGKDRFVFCGFIDDPCIETVDKFIKGFDLKDVNPSFNRYNFFLQYHMITQLYTEDIIQAKNKVDGELSRIKTAKKYQKRINK